MDPIFQTWRAEIEQQLDEARDQLVGCKEALDAATIAEREAKTGRADLAEAFEKLARQQIATALLNRLFAREDELKQAEALRSLCRFRSKKRAIRDCRPRAGTPATGRNRAC